MYRPPGEPVKFLEDIVDYVSDPNNERSRGIIAGDFNLPGIFVFNMHEGEDIGLGGAIRRRPGIRCDELEPGKTVVKKSELLLEKSFNKNLKQIVSQPWSSSFLQVALFQNTT